MRHERASCDALPRLPLEGAAFRPSCNASNRYCGALRAVLPLDPAARWINWSFPSRSCARLHHRCTQPLTSSSDRSSRPMDAHGCARLRAGCLLAHSARSKCVFSTNACISLTREGLRIEGPRKARKVHKRRRAEAERYRLELPAVLRSDDLATSRCTSAARRLRGNWTLISPVWPTNFGESMLGAFHALHALGPTDGLLLAGSELLRREWPAVRPMWAETLRMLWPGAALELVAPGEKEATLLAEGLRVCHTRDSFDEGRRAQHGLQMSLLGAAARPRLGEAARPRRPLRVGIVTRSSASARRITNEDELVAGCPRGLRCEKVALDEAGAERNARRVLRYHALVALHGAHVTYASFPERPLALLEVKPHAMFPSWFQHFHPSAFALDTWMYVYDAGPHPGDAATRVAGHTTRRLRASANGNKQPAALPLPIFRQFACLVAERFESYYRAPPLALRPAVRALL